MDDVVMSHTSTDGGRDGSWTPSGVRRQSLLSLSWTQEASSSQSLSFRQIKQILI